MRGSPLLRALIAFFCILGLGYPIWKLTDQGAPQIPVAESGKNPAEPKSTIRLQLSFTAPPSSVKVRHLGQAIWEISSPGQEVEKEFSLEYPKEGVDLEFDVEWPGDALSAMRVVLIDPEGTEHEKSMWGRGETSEVLTFP